MGPITACIQCTEQTDIHLSASFPGQLGLAGTRKVKQIWILMKQEMARWQWRQLNHVQINCTSPQTQPMSAPHQDTTNVSTSSLNVLHAGFSLWRPTIATNSVKALKADFNARNIQAKWFHPVYQIYHADNCTKIKVKRHGVNMSMATIPYSIPGAATSTHTHAMSYFITFITFAWVVDDAKCIVVTRVCVSVCLSAAVRPHYCTDPDVSWGRDRGCPLVVHYWADLQSGHRLHCFGNTTRTLVTSLRLSCDMTT